MKIKIMNINELNKITSNLEIKSFSNIFLGFTFFGFSDINNCYNDNADFIVAFNGNEIIGILKYSIKICSAGIYWDYQLTTGEIYTSMHYIDIKENYKGKGIGRELIKFFNTIIDKSISLLISEEWGDGLILGTHRMFKKYIDNTNIVFNTCYGYYSYKDISNNYLRKEECIV